MPLTDDKRAELQVEAWQKTVEVQQHFNDLALRIRNLFVTLLAATITVIGYGIKATVPSSTASLSVLIQPYVPLVTGLGVAICCAFWFLDRLWYHRLLRGAVKMGNALEARLEPELGDIGLTRTIGEASHMKFGRFTLDATLRLDLFYGLFAVVIIFVGESIRGADGPTVVETAIGVVIVGLLAIWDAAARRD